MNHTLGVGETVVVETLEVLHLPSHIGAFGFPPTIVSNVGVLVTNLAHVCPDYHGSIKFTLVNMGRKPYSLRHGDHISTTLLFSLRTPALKDYSARNPTISKQTPAVGVKEGTLASLPPDFLDLENRAEEAAKNAVTGTWEFRTSMFAAAGAAISLIANLWIDANRVADLRADLALHKAAIEQQLDIESIAAKSKKIGQENASSVRNLESQLNRARI